MIKEKIMTKLDEVLHQKKLTREEQSNEFFHYAIQLLADEMDKHDELFTMYSYVDALRARDVYQDKILNDYLKEIIDITNSYMEGDPVAVMIAFHIKNMCEYAQDYLDYCNRKENEKC